MWAFSREFRMCKETEDTETVVDGNKNDALCRPFLCIEFRLRAPSFAISTAMDPQCNRKLRICLAGSRCPYVKVKTVLAVWRFLAITPFGCISTRIVNRLIARMPECVGDLHAFPWNYRLRLFPTEISDRRCSIRDTSVDCDTFDVSGYALNLSAFDCKDRTFLLLCTCCKQQWKKKIE